MKYFYDYLIKDLFTNEEITVDGIGFSINSPEEAALLLQVLNTGYVQQGQAPRAMLEIKPIMVRGIPW